MEKLEARFENHELTEVHNADGFKVFSFRNKNGDGFFYQRWIIDRGTLIVQGDCYDAIYKWNESNITLEFLATCDIWYFNEKCRADKDGQAQKKFDASSAEDYLKVIATDRILENSDEFEDIDWKAMSSKERFDLVRPIIVRTLDIDDDDVDGLFCCENASEGYEILNKKEHRFMFGIDGWEYAQNLEVLTITPRMHLAALRVAYKKYPNAF